MLCGQNWVGLFDIYARDFDFFFLLPGVQFFNHFGERDILSVGIPLERLATEL